MRLREPVVLRLVRISLIQSTLLFFLFLDLFFLYWMIFVRLTLELVLLIDLISGWVGICSHVESDRWGPYCTDLNVRKGNLSLSYIVAQFTIVPAGLLFITAICAEILLEYGDRSSMFYNWWRHKFSRCYHCKRLNGEDKTCPIISFPKLNLGNCEGSLSETDFSAIS